MAYSNSWSWNNGQPRTMTLAISETVNAAGNSSTVNWSVTSSGSQAVTVAPTTVYINNALIWSCGKTSYSSNTFPAVNGSESGSFVIKHNSEGKANGIQVSFSTNLYDWTPHTVISGTFDLTPIATYTLSTSAGSNSSITVNRTSSSTGATGNISNGTRLYYGDVLRITFGTSSGYLLNTHTVNGAAFTSGSSHTVKGNVSVVSSAYGAKSTIKAINANIGSNTTITITRQVSSYTHTVTYSFSGLTGTIATKTTSTSFQWTVPTSFYAKIPNAKTGTCTLTCETFTGNTSLGSNTCTFTVTATGSPTVTGTVTDTNSTTTALTGNSSKLVKYYSTAHCVISASAQNSASISSKKIAGTTVSGTTRDISNTTTTSYEFSATDSRGYTTTKTVTPTMVSYVKLTCVPNVYRPSPTGSSIDLQFSGDYWNGNFGAQSNTLTLSYRWQEAGGDWSSWTTITSSQITISSSTYKQASTITIGTSFDYLTTYNVEFEAVDKLATIKKTVVVKPGIPVFDWGKNDFVFNVPVCMRNITANRFVYFDDDRYAKGNSVPSSTYHETGMYFRDVNRAALGWIGYGTSPDADGVRQNRLCLRIFRPTSGSGDYRQLNLYCDGNNLGTMSWNGNATFSGTLAVSGAATLSSTLKVTGNTTHVGHCYFANGTTYYINSSGTGKLNALTTTGAITAAGNITSQSNKIYVGTSSEETNNVNVVLTTKKRQTGLSQNIDGSTGMWNYTNNNWIWVSNTDQSVSVPHTFKVTANGTVDIDGGRIELYAAQPYIDFHYNKTTADFTSRIIEDASGRLSFMKTTSTYLPLYAASYNTGSSRRIKSDIMPINEDDAEKVLLLEPSTFIVRGEDKRSAGLIAEDAYKTLPLVVNMPDGYDEEEYSQKSDDEITGSELPTINYQELIPYMIKLLQMQDARIKQLEEKE